MKNKAFDQILMRLKAQLNISQNKKIALLLGMTYDGFYARRQRDSFPEEKLRILGEQRPDLNLDIDYILTGATKGNVSYASAATATVVHTRETSTQGYSSDFVQDVHEEEDVRGALARHNKLLQELYEQMEFEPPFSWSGVFQELLLKKHIDMNGVKCILEQMIERRAFYENKISELEKQVAAVNNQSADKNT